MAIAAEDLLNYSTKLCTDVDEVSRRSSVSRAYYAAFHKCQEWHSNLPSPGSAGTNKGGVHEILINQLVNPTIVDKKVCAISRALGYMLKQLRQHRVTADYVLTENISVEISRNACASSKLIFAKAT
jgi:uncharacterized protein (UPF0332 family)